VRHGIFLAPFGPLADPNAVVRLAARAEAAGWDGFFVWDHVFYVDVDDLADPWVTMAAITGATERLVLGPMVTPLARRRIVKLARETVTLDRLSSGRLVLGVGLGGNRSGEFDGPGEEPDPRRRAVVLDQGLSSLTKLWAAAGADIPVWVASKGLAPAPLRRAARWQGWFPVEIESPDEFAEGVATIADHRGGATETFDFVIAPEAGHDANVWAEAGATWLLAGFGSHPDPAEVAAVIEAGPPGS
jgi:alkanesulfonate monooxygenase SsuD/methylene tetrahydromethanopterin reductase-like flavin-dependent oxidoreductase (luciferase family)